MRRLAWVWVLAVGCATAPATVGDRGAAVPLRARATFELGHVTRIEVAMPEGHPLVVRPLHQAFGLGGHPVVRRLPGKPDPTGVIVDWPSDARETWVGDTGELWIDTLQGVQNHQPDQWVGDVAGRLLVRLVRPGDPEGAQIVRTVDVAFQGGVYSAGKSTSGY